MEQPAVEPVPVPFVQPRPWIRWLAVILAAAGWYVSLNAFGISAQTGTAGSLVTRLCGGPDAAGVDQCTAVLTSPQAYVELSKEPGAPRIPMATFGMAYFAALLLWYLLIGPPTYDRRAWLLLPVLVLIPGIWYSVAAIRGMAVELQQWCPICLTAHALNGGLVLLTLLAWPWSPARRLVRPHPSARLALAVFMAGFLAFLVHVLYVLTVVASGTARESQAEYKRIVEDPQFARWDFQRQQPVDIPLQPDEAFGGTADAPHTVAVFGDFQCSLCLEVHKLLTDVARKYPDQIRLAFRYYPQDPACNPNPRYRLSGHASACRAAQAAEASRQLGGREAYLAMSNLLWERQQQLPKTPPSQQTDEQRGLFENWAGEIGLNPENFRAALDSRAVSDRIRADIELAGKLGISAVPVVYLDGRRVLGWSNPATWDALLGETAAPASQPTTAPAAP